MSEMKRSRLAAAVVGAALVSMLTVVAQPTAAGPGAEPTAALFYDPAYTDTTTDGGGEAFNVRTTLDDLGVTTTLIETIDVAAWEAALPADVLVIPELEEDEGLGDDLSPEAKALIDGYVREGGRLFVFGSSDPWPTVNAIFGTSIASAGDDTCGEGDGEPPLCSLTAAGAGTEFADAPQTLAYNDDTSGAADPATLPAGSRQIYLDSVTEEGGVTVIPFDLGSVVFLAWDWYGTQGEDLNEELDPNWYGVFAEALGVGVSAADTTAPAGQPLVFTVSLDETASQSVVVDYATADGTAVAGTDYQAEAGSVVIPAGQSSVTVTVPTLADGEGTVLLDVSTPMWGVTVDGQATGTITAAAAAPTTAAAAPARVTPAFTG